MRSQRMWSEEVRSWEYESHIVWKYSWSWFGKFMKLLEVKVHCHEFEVCHMSSRFIRIMNQLRRFMNLVKYFSNIGWKVHELAWSLHKIQFASYQRSIIWLDHFSFFSHWKIHLHFLVVWGWVRKSTYIAHQVLIAWQDMRHSYSAHSLLPNLQTWGFECGFGWWVFKCLAYRCKLLWGFCGEWKFPHTVGIVFLLHIKTITYIFFGWFGNKSPNLFI